MILTGIGELTRGELAGERMDVAYEQRSQEDEHSCFSRQHDRRHPGQRPGHRDGAHRPLSGRRRRSRPADRCSRPPTPTLAAALREAVDASVADLEAIPAPFDQHLVDGVPDDDPGRASVLAAIEALEAQADALVAAAAPARHHARRSDQRGRTGESPASRGSRRAFAMLIAPACSERRRRSAACSTRSSAATRLGTARTRTSFSFPAPNLTSDERRTFAVGNSFFNENWVTAPASTDARDGLGPMFNAQSCSSCHFLDGRGVPPTPTGDTDADRPAAAPVGARGDADRRPGRPSRLRRPAAGPLDPRRPGRGDARRHASRPIEGTYADGTPYTLVSPTYAIGDPAVRPSSATTR